MQLAMTKALETQVSENLSATVRKQEGRRSPALSAPEIQDPLSAPGIYTFWRGRVALYGILKSLAIGPGDSVLVPGYTCFAVPAAVLFAGALPLYVDIEPDTFNISSE